MKITHYDSRGLFIGETVAELDPLEQKPLIPASATDAPAPAAQAGKVRAFIGGAWLQFTDNSGAWYDAAGVETINAHPLDSKPVGAVRAARPDATYTLTAGAWVQDAAKVAAKARSDGTAAISAMLNQKARDMRYDDITSARSYAGYTNPFQAEALRLADWSAACWMQAGSIEAQIIAGTLPLQTPAQVLSLMPVFV